MSKRKKFYITTAIDYPSGKPHAGHAYEKICADVLARWFRLSLGKNKVFFQTGMDEHGLKILKLAKKQKMKPQKYVDMMAKFYYDLCKAYNISYDNFIRTTDADHEKFCQKILTDVHDKGDIYKGEYEGLYCLDCETFYTESELDNGTDCPYHHKPCEQMKEESYFFKMSKYQKQVEKNLKNGYAMPKHWNTFILNRMKEGVKDLSISRTTFEWGIPLPFDKKHINYVWFDALLNYVSGLDKLGLKKKFWPADVHLIGHDILWHHSVIWLSILTSAKFELPKNVFVHGFINAEDGKKMSKSLGNVIDPMEIVAKYPVDSIRYFFIREIPFGSDGNFSTKALIARHNNELANDLGNLLQRTTVMIRKYFDGQIPKKTKDELSKNLNFKKIEDYMENYDITNALAELWKFINECNKYINDKKPWELAKKDMDKLQVVIYNLAEALRMVAIILEPFMPTTAENIAAQLGIKNFDKMTFKDLKFGKIKQNKIPKPEILFAKIEEIPKEEPKKAKETMVTFDEWKKMNFKVGTVVKAEQHPNADKLYVLKVDIGNEERQVVAGISKFYKLKELEGKKVVILTNLVPAKLRGVESQGMLLAAEDDKGTVKLLTVDGDILSGAQVE